MFALLFSVLISLEELSYDCQFPNAFEISYRGFENKSLNNQKKDSVVQFQISSSSNQLLCTHILNILKSEYVEVSNGRFGIKESPWFWYKQSDFEVFFYKANIFAVISNESYSFDLVAEDAYRIFLALENHLLRVCLNDSECKRTPKFKVD